ncbi:MAG: cysteine--tRNA ligase [Lachnospiraceae bacterium]|nr:cysteine--tRNA ligase [Lachnospiraceae bacterium]
MKFYNTLTMKKEEFVPIEPGKVSMYVCGPTVYNLIHIGNARPMIVFDTARRYMEHKGYEVNYVSNFTDVDDKIINRANEEGVSTEEISERYIEECKKDMQGMNVREATTHPKATCEIDGMIEMIRSLIDKGFAYEVNGTVYFRTRKDPHYGKLSHKNLDDLRSGGRSLLVTGEDEKEDPLDFVLWKPKKEGEPFWKSPWSDGRPGWHIECSVMSKKYLGSTIDIHAGGEDLVFPHHENEIAQSECCNGEQFVRYWVHNGYVNVDNKKMSKSLGNFFTVRDVAKEYGYEPIRFFAVSAHYRSPINFNREVMDQCKASLARLHTCRDNLDFAIKNASGNNTDLIDKANERKMQFENAMDDDLNTANGFTAIFELVSDINSAKDQSKEALEYAASVFDSLTDVLGFDFKKKEEGIPEDILDLVERRAQAKKDRDFALADALRNEITGKGYVVEDTPQGPKVTKK